MVRMSLGGDGALAGFGTDEVSRPATRTRRKEPQNSAELLGDLASHGLRAYARKLALPQLGRSLKTEEKPELNDMSDISQAVATRLDIPDGLRATAVKVALNRVKEKEQHTELTTGDGYTEDIPVLTDQSALSREAKLALQTLPQAEDEDYVLIVQVLASRLRGALDEELENLPPEAQPAETKRVRLSRDAAHWVIRKGAQELCEAMFSEIARRAKLIDARPLPDVMVFPDGIALERSAKNIHGVLPPSTQDGERVAQELLMDDRQWLADKSFTFEDGNFSQGQCNGT